MPMSDKKRWIRLAVAAGLGAAAGAWTYQIEKDKKAENDARLAAVEAAVVRSRDYGKQKAYIIGNGLSSLAAAVWLIKDCHFPGSSIMVFGEGTEGGRWKCRPSCSKPGKLRRFSGTVWKTARIPGKKCLRFPKTEGGERLGLGGPSGTLAAVVYRRGAAGCFKR